MGGEAVISGPGAPLGLARRHLHDRRLLPGCGTICHGRAGLPLELYEAVYLRTLRVRQHVRSLEVSKQTSGAQGPWRELSGDILPEFHDTVGGPPCQGPREAAYS